VPSAAAADVSSDVDPSSRGSDGIGGVEVRTAGPLATAQTTGGELPLGLARARAAVVPRRGTLVTPGSLNAAISPASAAVVPASAPIALSRPPKTVAASAGELRAKINAAVVRWFDSAAAWLAGLPAGPLTDGLSGALLLVRRTFFNQVPTVQSPVQLVTNSAGQATGRIESSDPEFDSLTYRLVDVPQHGTVTIGPDGQFTYTAESAADLRTDSFTVEVANPGFNILDPLGDRWTTVDVEVGSLLHVGSSQGFDIINLTNEVLWLARSAVVSEFFDGGESAKFWVESTCQKQNFCLDSSTGRALRPGEALPFQAETGTDVFVYMDWVSADGRQWQIGVKPRFRNSQTQIGWYYDLSGGQGPKPPAPNPSADYGVTYGQTPPCPDGSSGSCSPPRQPYEYSQENGNRLFLTEGPGQTHTFTADTVVAGKPPSWCGYCQIVDTVGNSSSPALDPITILNTYLGVNQGRFPRDFVPKYSSVTFDYKVDERYANQSLDGVQMPIRVANLSGSAGVTTTYNWTVTADPGPQPTSPWWQKYAAQGAGAAAQALLKKFVGDGIANAAGPAIQKLLSPQEVKSPVTATGTQAVTSLPYSVNLVLVPVGGYDVNGDIEYSIRGCLNNRCEDTKFVFKDVPFKIIDRRPSYNSEIRAEPIQSNPNQGFELLGSTDKSDTYSPRPTYTPNSTDHLIKVNAFKGGGSDGSIPEDFSARGCSEDVTTNCITFSSSDTSVAEIAVQAQRAILNAKNPGQAVVTAVYRWIIPIGGVDQTGNSLPPETGSVTASMVVNVTANS